MRNLGLKKRGLPAELLHLSLQLLDLLLLFPVGIEQLHVIGHQLVSPLFISGGFRLQGLYLHLVGLVVLRTGAAGSFHFHSFDLVFEFN